MMVRKPVFTGLLGLLCVMSANAATFQCGDGSYTPTIGTWSCAGNGVVTGKNDRVGFATIEKVIASQTGHWAVSGYSLPGQWEEIAMIFAENSSTSQYAVIHISYKDQLIGVGTIDKRTGSYDAFVEYYVYPNGIKQPMKAEIARDIDPTTEFDLRVEVDSITGMVRPLVTWDTQWGTPQALTAEMRRYTFEDPSQWTPKTGWFVKNGQCQFQNLNYAPIAADAIFTLSDPQIRYSLSKRLLTNMGFEPDEKDPQNKPRYNVYVPCDSYGPVSDLFISVFQHGRKTDFQGTIALSACHADDAIKDQNDNPITSYTFKPEDRGSAHLRVSWGSPGYHRVTVVDANGKTWNSNYTHYTQSAPDYILIWGDFHAHTENSADATGTVEHFFDHAINGAFLEFAGPSDHSESLSQKKFEEEIHYEEKLSKQMKRFVPLPGYEWTSSTYGHNNVYFVPKTVVNQGVEEWVVPQRYSSGNIEFGSDRTNMVPKLQELAGLIPQEVSDVLLIPHHPGSGTFPTDWRFWYPSLQRVVEITSWWGTSEVYGAPTSIFVLGEDYAGPGHYVRDALNLGVRTGVIGSSDSHDGQPGYDTGYISYALGGYSASVQNASAAEAKYGGLTGLYVKDLSLNSIFEALKARRTMASANERRIRTDLRINGHWQGEELNLLPGTILDIQIDVVGQDEFEYIEVIRNGELFASVPIQTGKQIYSIQFGATVPKEGTDYYYVRVKQLDTTEGFSSPIWITADPNSTPVLDWSLHE